jgi:hypothetical protein
MGLSSPSTALLTKSLVTKHHLRASPYERVERHVGCRSNHLNFCVFFFSLFHLSMDISLIKIKVIIDSISKSSVSTMLDMIIQHT